MQAHKCGHKRSPLTILGLLLSLALVFGSIGCGSGNLPDQERGTPQTAVSIPVLPTATATTSPSPPAPASSTNWVPFGPDGIFDATEQLQNVSGRLNAVAVAPGSSTTILVGAAGGGVWKTTDGGTTWKPMSDNQPNLVIGALAYAPSNSQIVYAGTGEALPTGDSFSGGGVMKSTDGGNTWNFVPGSSAVTDTGISRIAVDPTDPNTLYVSTYPNGLNGNFNFQWGLYKSTDGGNSFTNVTNNFILDTSNKPFPAPVTDVQILPGTSGSKATLYIAVDTNLLFFLDGLTDPAGNSGIWTSTDAGTTWKQLNAAGLPTTDQTGRITLAFSPTAPKTLYSLIGSSDESSFVGLFGTLDANDTSSSVWKQVQASGVTVDTLLGAGVGQSDFGNCIAVDRTDTKTVYMGGVQPAKMSQIDLTQGTGTLTTLGGSRTSPPGDDSDSAHPHVDDHALAVDSSGDLLIGCDGGLWSLANPDNASTSTAWTNLNGTAAGGSPLETIEFYGVALDPFDPTHYYGGSQDNGSEIGQGSRVWSEELGGDGYQCRFDPVQKNVVFAEFEFEPGFINRATDGGTTPNSFQDASSGIDFNDGGGFGGVVFSVPYIVHPKAVANGHDATTFNLMALGTTRVYETVHNDLNGVEWADVSGELQQNDAVTSLGYSRNNSTVLYAGFDNGTMFVRTTAASGFVERDSGLPLSQGPFSPIQNIVVADSDPSGNTAYCTVSAPGNGIVFKTTDGGLNWNDISSNLPNVAAFGLAQDNTQSPAVLYISADNGVYASFDDGGSWSRFGNGLPNGPVWDLAIDPSRGVLAAATHGRGMWEVPIHAGVSVTSPPITQP